MVKVSYNNSHGVMIYERDVRYLFISDNKYIQTLTYKEQSVWYNLWKSYWNKWDSLCSTIHNSWKKKTILSTPVLYSVLKFSVYVYINDFLQFISTACLTFFGVNEI